MSLRTARARDRCLASADQRRRQHAGAAGEAPGGAGNGGAGGRAGRAPHGAAAVLSGDPHRAAIRGRRSRASARFAPDAVHVATEGPLGFWTIGWLRRQRPALHHQLPHALPRVPQRAPAGPARVGLHARALVPRAAPSTRWSSSMSLMRELRRAAASGSRLVHWPRGVDTERLPSRAPARRGLRPAAADLALRRARRGREEPRGLPDAAAARARRWWSATARRARRCSAASPTSSGAAGASATSWPRTSPAPTASCSRRAPRRSATCCWRRMASGLPVASVPAPGPSTSSRRASTAPSTTTCWRPACARSRCSRDERAREHRAPTRCAAGHEVFRAHLVPLQPRAGIAPERCRPPDALRGQLRARVRAGAAAAGPSGSTCPRRRCRTAAARRARTR